MIKFTVKQFFLPRALDSDTILINGIGIGEVMEPCLVDRPHGTDDYLLMAFFDPMQIAAHGILRAYPANTVVLWEPRAQHFYGSRTGHWRHSWIHCSGDRIDALVSEVGIPLSEPFTLGRPEMIDHYLWEAYREMTEHGEPLEEIVCGALRSCLIDLRRQREGEQSAIPPEFMALKQYLGQNLQERLTLTHMADRVHLSRSHFSSQFKRYLGLSPIEYVIRLRLHAAVNLLGDRNRPIAAIAQEVGYDDPFLFTRQFKDRFHISPREMRRQLTQKPSPPPLLEREVRLP